jgi:GPH family glycoside/pentoside/hexuronide:cation symporter
VNDPFLGYLSDLDTKLSRKFGRRFPEYVIGSLAFTVAYFMIFVVPFSNQIGMFIWLVVFICIYEFLFSLWQVGYLSLFPEKFRSNKERTKVGSWCTIWGVVGMVLGVMIPPLFITYGDISSYIIAAAVVMIMGLMVAFFSFPGMREDKELIKQQHERREIEKEKAPFIETVKFALKDKNFLVYVIVYLCHQTLTVLMLASLPFWNKYIIGSSNPDVEIIISAGFLIGVIFSVPLWAFIGRKYGNRKGFIAGGLTTTLALIPLLFVGDILGTAISIGLVGLGVGAIWVLMFPCFSDVIDDVVVRTNKRQEGVYTGIRTFVGRASFVVQAIVFAVVHELTGYIAGATPGKTSQPPLALWGIREIMALIPMIFYFIGFLLMVFIYDLTKERVQKNNKIISERGL